MASVTYGKHIIASLIMANITEPLNIILLNFDYSRKI